MFRAASKEVRELCRSGDHLDLHRRKRPWWGGFWERSVKKKVIGRTSLTYDQLQTLNVEIEGLLNARPFNQYLRRFRILLVSFESFSPSLRTLYCQLTQWSIFRSYKHEQIGDSKASTQLKVTGKLCKAVENRVRQCKSTSRNRSWGYCNRSK